MPDSIGAFAVVAARERELGVPVTLENLAGFGWERPFLGVSMWVFVLGMLGFPLTGGFFGKFYVFSAAIGSGHIWLAIIGWFVFQAGGAEARMLTPPRPALAARVRDAPADVCSPPASRSGSTTPRPWPTSRRSTAPA